MCWNDWVTHNNVTATQYVQHAWLTAPAKRYRPSVEQLQREQNERALVAERARVAEQGRIAARDRAKALLQTMLTDEQWSMLQHEGYFLVVGSHTKKRYQIKQGTHGNVTVLDDHGRPVTRYCGQPNDVPTEDAMLAQKLMLEIHEEDYLRAANATRL